MTAIGVEFNKAIADAAGKLLCKVWSDEESSDALLRRVYGRNGSAVIGAPVRYSKRAFRYVFCDSTIPDLPGEYLPLGIAASIGRCPVGYDVVAKLNAKYLGQPYTDTKTIELLGPLGKFFVVVNPERTSYSVRIPAQGSSEGVAIFSLGGVQDGWTDIVATYTATRQDGQPDNCGEPGDNRPRYRGPMTYPTPSGPVTNNVNIVIGNPRANKGGNGLTIPIGWADIDGEINGEFDIDPELNLDFNPGDGDGDGGRIDPDSPVPPGGPDDPPPNNNNKLMVGAVVVVRKIGEGSGVTEYGNGESPNLYLPRCASLMFAVEVVGSGAWMQPIDIEVLKQWVPVPGDFPAYFAVAKPMNGYEADVYPMYQDESEEGV